MRELCRLVLGLEWEEVCRHPRRYRAKPFVELLDFSYTSEGQTIGPRTSAKLHADFVGFAANARKHYRKHPDLVWMWQVYKHFRRAFRLAANSGFVCYW
jgi:hypothetical protein